MMNRGGQEGIDTKVKAAVVEMWEKLLCQKRKTCHRNSPYH